MSHKGLNCCCNSSQVNIPSQESMSPQSTPFDTSPISPMKANMRVKNTTKMSTSELAEAASASFSMHQRLDSCIERPALSSNPLDESPFSNRLHLRKRRVSVSGNTVDKKNDFNTDFLSGIFQDIAEANSYHEPTDIDGCAKTNTLCNVTDTDNYSEVEKQNIYRTNKKARKDTYQPPLRSCMSYRLISDALPVKEKQSSGNSCCPNSSGSRSNTRSYRTNDSNTVDKNLMHIIGVYHESPSQATCDYLTFPNLPATVSESSCSRNNSMHSSNSSSRHAANSPSKDGIPCKKACPKDTYGWFVQMDNDDDNSFSKELFLRNRHEDLNQDNDLSFQAAIAPKKNDIDADVEWAKAADTIDDVLGDLF
mmetsp:Transcript_7222/g.10346  ORF Transcript_7222/g.10346 Transcript_7222/m.10346 type:complete len:366 (-) Transcript_7222:399-1496(-)